MKCNLLKTVIATAVLGLAAPLAFAANGQANQAQNNYQNPHAPAYGHHYRHGAVPTREAWARMKHYAQLHAALTTPATGTKTLSYGGGVNGIGVTSGTPKVYVVVYGSQWGTASTNSSGNMTLSNDPNGAVPYLESLFKGLGTGGELWSGVMTQYCDGPAVSNGATSCPSNANFIGYPTGGAFAGIWYDNSVSSPSSATAAQLAQEAIKAAAHFGNTTAASNRYAQYVILSPTGTTPDGFNTSSGNFCAWHDYNGDAGVSSSYGDIAFTNMPYVSDAGTSCGQSSVNSGSAGTLDGFSIVEGHEYAETVTDQNPAGGWTNHTGSSSNGQENGDECAWISSGQGASANVTMGTGTFPMQSTWSNDTNECDISHPIVGGGGSTGGTPSANFSYVANGLTVSFTDSSTDNGGTISSHAWTFGDGSTSTATNPSHTYAAAGTYSVKETVTDSANGQTSSKTSSVTVASSGGGGGGNVLQNGVALTGQAAATGGQLFYTVVIPAGASNLVIAESGGTGDADLYTKFGSAPTLSSYDCRPYITGNNESCTVASPQAGTYYVMLNGYAAFSGVSIKATWSTSSGNVPPVANFSDSISNLTVNFTDSSTDSDGTIASRTWTFGDGSTSTATNPSHTYAAAGTYSVKLTVTDNGGATNSKTASVTVSSGGGGGGNQLQNGVALTGQAAATGGQLFYTVVIPAGASNLVIAESGGTGDADLYTKFGSNPTLSSYDCRPYITGNNESCTVASPQAGTYYVMLNAYAAFSGVSIKATWSTSSGGGGGNVLSNGVPATGLSASTGNSVAYTMVVPAGATNLSFKIAGSSGDADLYVKFGSAPTTSSYDCRPYLYRRQRDLHDLERAGGYLLRDGACLPELFGRQPDR